MAYRQLSVAAAAAVLAAACTVPVTSEQTAPASAGPGEVPFEYAGAGEAAVVVPVTINGKGPFDLVLDTGATLTCVDQGLAEELGLPEKPGVLGRGAGVGGAGAVDILGIDTLAVGTAEARDLTACALDLSQLEQVAEGVRGLLGLNFLRSYRVTIDFERQTVRLEPPSGPGEPVT